MKHSILIRCLRGCAALLATVSVATSHAAIRESNPTLPDVETQFARLRSHADFLGFQHDSDVAPRADGSPSDTHYQGIARAQIQGKPYLFVTRSGMDDDARGNLMIVRMGSRDSDGERLRSNRLRSGRSVERTEPPATDRVVANVRFRNYHHPGGIQVCGDILVVPLEGATEDYEPTGKVLFYDVSDPENPKRLRPKVESEDKIGVAGLAQLPDGTFLLVTTGGDGRYLTFYKSTKDSFTHPDFEFVKYDTFDGFTVKDGVWAVGPVSLQSLQLLVQFNPDSGHKLYLLGGLNDSALVPIVPGSDILTLYEVTGWKSGGAIQLRQKQQRVMNVTSENWPTELAKSGASKTLYNADFLAGLSAYISPTAELLVYAVEHYNWGPGKTVRFAEFRHEQVYREGNSIYEKQLRLSAPTYVMEDDVVTLDAGKSQRMGSLRPWVELFDHDNYEGRSVIVDWMDRNEDDFDDFRALDGFGDGLVDGFNDRTSSVRWFAPFGWKIRLYDSDHQQNDEPTLDLGGVNAQLGIRNLSEKPYEFDNDNSDLTETRVTSMKFIPPDDDNGWEAPLEHLTFTWRLLDVNLNPVPEAIASLTPDPRSPWLAKLQTHTKGPDMLFVELLMGPPPLARELRPIRFLARNRAPILANVEAKPFTGGLVNVQAYVKDEDSSDAITLSIDWGDATIPTKFKGTPGARVFGASHVYANPDPDSVNERPYVIRVLAVDSIEALSEPVDVDVRVLWRVNAAPQVGPDSFVRTDPGEFRVLVNSLTTNDRDPDGDDFEFGTVRAAEPAGATVRLEGREIIYTPSPDAPSAPGGFEYTLRDQFGRGGSGRVTLVSRAGRADGPAIRLKRLQSLANRGVTALFEGTPGQSYDVLGAESLEGPWVVLSRALVAPDGTFQIKDAQSGNVRYYRVQQVLP